jgi:hypothetical protein
MRELTPSCKFLSNACGRDAATYVVERDGETFWTIAERRLQQGGGRPASDEVMPLARWLRAINGADDALRPGRRIFFGRAQEGVAD